MTAQIKDPIIIIGAGRSGTNMLRNMLTEIPGLGTWPCDEINYIWRHGNVRHPTDELSAMHATRPTQRFILNAFDQVAKAQKVDRIVEKTCANSLRVSFVDEVVPNAKYIFMVRDGRDVVASALKRWSAPLDIQYILKKARYVPLGDLPYYAVRYMGHHLYRFSSDENRLSTWGPRFEGMDAMLTVRTLPEICAAQWVRCVERSESDFADMPDTKVFRLRYEDFVSEPQRWILDIASFLEIDLSPEHIRKITASVSQMSLGKWRNELSSETVSLIAPILESSLQYYRYLEAK